MSIAGNLADFAHVADEMNGRNRIINGAFDIWQRGTSFAAAETATFSADRWKYTKGTTDAVHTLARSTDVPDDVVAQYSLLIDCTTADAVVSSSEFVLMQTTVEGWDIHDLVGNTFTLCFWVKATKTGTYCVSFRNSGNDRSYIAEYTVDATDTWEFKTVTVVDGLPTAGTWDYATGVGLRVTWALTVGDTFWTTPGAWKPSNYLATANQVNASDNVANDFRLAEARLTRTPVAAAFRRRLHGHELLLCQRYYCEFAARTINGTLWIPFPATMRAAPTVAASTGTAANGKTNGCTLAHSAEADTTITADAEL